MSPVGRSSRKDSHRSDYSEEKDTLASRRVAAPTRTILKTVTPKSGVAQSEYNDLA